MKRDQDRKKKTQKRSADSNADNKQEEQVQLLHDVAKNIQGKCLCALGEFSVMGVLTSIERFPEDFGREPKVPE